VFDPAALQCECQTRRTNRQPNSQQHIAKNLVTLAMLFFLLYCAIVGFKTISVEAIAFAGIDSEFVCNADCMKVVNVIIYKERFDHLRTASVSLLIAFLIGVNLLGTAHAPRRRFAIALCAPLVIASAFLAGYKWGFAYCSPSWVCWECSMRGGVFAHRLSNTNEPVSYQDFKGVICFRNWQNK